MEPAGIRAGKDVLGYFGLGGSWKGSGLAAASFGILVQIRAQGSDVGLALD